MYLTVLAILLIIIVLATILYVAYHISAAFQQTITITVPFEDTYRYVPNLNRHHHYKVVG